jgi:hypothetical protein
MYSMNQGIGSDRTFSNSVTSFLLGGELDHVKRLYEGVYLNIK